jgi:hypothetical protein
MNETIEFLEAGVIHHNRIIHVLFKKALIALEIKLIDSKNR